MLHPWLRDELAAVLAALPPLPPEVAATRAARSYWAAWQERLGVCVPLPEELPPLRVLLVWDNLAGHKSPSWSHGGSPTGCCRCTPRWAAPG